MYGQHNLFGRNSPDNKGKELVASPNAYWLVDQMCFGDGGAGRGTTIPSGESPNDLVS